MVNVSGLGYGGRYPGVMVSRGRLLGVGYPGVGYPGGYTSRYPTLPPRVEVTSAVNWYVSYWNVFLYVKVSLKNST